MTENEKAKLKIEWDNSPELQAEFANRFELFAAYREDIPGVKVRENNGAGCTKEAFNPTNF